MLERPNRESRRTYLAGSILIVLLSALGYLLLINHFGFSNDDWYLAYAGLVGGSSKYIDVFAIDRPFRAYLVGFIFNLFKLNAPLYGYVSYAIRISGAFGMLWLLRQVWPQHNRFTALLAALFVVYPGWMNQPTGFDYQSHLLSFSLTIFSLALMVYAWRVYDSSDNRLAGSRIGWWAIWTGLAVIFQLISLLLMEYYIGLEGFRFVLLLYLASSRNPLKLIQRSGRLNLRRFLMNWFPYLAGVSGFLIWRLVIFKNTRSATDIGGIFSILAGSPFHTGLTTLIYLIQDFINATFAAWLVPLYKTTFQLRLRDSLIALAIGALAAALVWAAWQWMKRTGKPNPTETNPEEPRDMLWLGFFGVVFSSIPIALGDRHIVFPDYSRFSLPASIGVLLIIGGVVLLLQQEKVRVVVIMGLAGLAVSANYGNSVFHADAWSSIRDFWWQVSWRAPQIKPNTVIVAQYSNGAIAEDYFVWGPADIIYYPKPDSPDGRLWTPLSSVVLTKENILAIQMGKALPDYERRSIVSKQDLIQTLVISMPETGSCVHVMDGQAPERSQKEDEKILLVANYSNENLILVDTAPHVPPTALFGTEPSHRWCYYYEKAALARQRGEWAEVAQLGDEAISQEMHPLDWVEWFPFIQAYAYLGQYDKADRIYPILADIQYLKYQGCEIFTKDAYDYQSKFPDGQKYLREKFCQ